MPGLVTQAMSKINDNEYKIYFYDNLDFNQ